MMLINAEYIFGTYTRPSFSYGCYLMLLTGYFVPIFFHTDFSVYPGPSAGLWDYCAVTAYSFSSKLFTRYCTDQRYM